MCSSRSRGIWRRRTPACARCSPKGRSLRPSRPCRMAGWAARSSSPTWRRTGRPMSPTCSRASTAHASGYRKRSMPNDAAQTDSPPASPTVWYSYAIVRVVPRVERGECINVGVILFARTRRFLEARIEFDPARLRALEPEVDGELTARPLAAFEAIGAGNPEGGPLAALPQSERFHRLTAPPSTMIQTSPVHVGRCADPRAALEDLLSAYVRPPREGSKV